MLPAALADKLRAVPIGRLAHDRDRIAIAVRDRLSEHAAGEIAFNLDVDPDQLVEAITPELRLYYHLELAYQIPRANRFLRVDSRTAINVPPPPDAGENSDVDGQAWLGESFTPPSYPVLVLPEPDPREPAALDCQTAPAVDDATGRARRRFVPKLGESPTALARIAVRQSTTDAQVRPVGALEPAPRTTDELTRTIRRAGSRDRVAAMVITALGDLASSPLDAAVMLVVRPPVAIGWKGFCSNGTSAIEALAVSLAEPSFLTTCYQSGVGLVVDLAETSPSRIDQAMWPLLGGRTPTHATVAPIVVGDQVVCLLYAQARAPLGIVAALVPILAEAAGIGFGRLLRAAQR